MRFPVDLDPVFAPVRRRAIVVGMGSTKSSVPEGRRKFGDVIRQHRFRCPCRGNARVNETVHGFRVGRLRHRAAPPVATFRRPSGAENRIVQMTVL